MCINREVLQVAQTNGCLTKVEKKLMRRATSFQSLEMGSLLSWNVRGLNGPNKQKEVKLLCNQEQVGLVGLLETKLKKE